ncbi:MAG: hypothetical protein HDQ91_00525, partial [Desulfovibrio sp.]|nr:hypothetical protein [Desulfovibrio sp.]
RKVAAAEDEVEDTSLLEAVASAKGETIGGNDPATGEAEAVTEDNFLTEAVAAAAEDVASETK